jgi:hypothetical protein
LQIDRSIRVDTTKNFFIAEFGHLEQRIEKTTVEDETEKYSNATLRPGASFYALRMLDSDFVQLERPFPYYKKISNKSLEKHPEIGFMLGIAGGIVGSAVYLGLTTGYSRTVSVFNNRLERFYLESMNSRNK